MGLWSLKKKQKESIEGIERKCRGTINIQMIYCTAQVRTEKGNHIL